MAFFQTRVQPNGAISAFHRVTRVEIAEQVARVTVNSFATEAALEAGMLNWQDIHAVPMADAFDAQAWLVSPEGPFAGATLMVEATALEVARSRKWAEIKAERDRRETSGFPYLGRMIDSDTRSVQRITIAAQAAQAAIVGGVPADFAWICADNSTVELDAQGMAGMPAALAVHAGALHASARALRERIDSATALEEVAAVAWPVEVAQRVDPSLPAT